MTPRPEATGSAPRTVPHARWCQMPYDIMEAIRRTPGRLGRLEWAILWEVLAGTLPPSRARGVPLSPEHLARRLGSRRPNTHRAIMLLAHKRLLRRLDDGTWGPGDDVVASPREVIPLAQAAPEPAGAVIPKEFGVISEDNRRYLKDNRTGPGRYLQDNGAAVAVIFGDNQTGPGVISEDNGAVVAIEERARLIPEELNSEEAEQSEAPRCAADNGETRSPEDDCPVYVEDGVYEIQPSGRHRPSPEQFRAVERVAWGLFGDRRLNLSLWEHQRFFAPEVWIAALREVKRRGREATNVRYVEAIAADYQANGIPRPTPPTAERRPRHGAEIPYRPTPSATPEDLARFQADRHREQQERAEARERARRESEVQAEARRRFEAMEPARRESLLAKVREDNPGLVRRDVWIERIAVSRIADRLKAAPDASAGGAP